MGYLNTPFGLIEIQAILRIVLESSHIVETSDTPDVVIRRCFLLRENYNYLIEIRTQPGLLVAFEEAVEEYKKTYFVNPVTKIQCSIILAATEDHYKSFFFVNIERSLYKYIDNQLDEISLLKRNDAKQRRISKVYSLLVNCNSEMLKLFRPIEKDDIYWEKISQLTRLVTNYFDLKLNSFDESLSLQVNGEEYIDENDAPINDAVRRLVKVIKAKLWTEQFAIRNQEYKIKLTVTWNNVALSFDENAGPVFTNKIKALFEKEAA